jgi:serine protease Do
MTALFAISSPGPASAANGPRSFSGLAQDLVPAVVNIASTKKVSPSRRPEGMPELPQFPESSPFKEFFEEFRKRRGPDAPAIPRSSLGSGFVINAQKGYIVTNSHVVHKADTVRVTFHNETTVEAEVIGRDDKTDLAVIQVDTDKLDFALKPVKFGDSADMKIGDWVLAIGNPFGLGGSVTAGIVSARQRDINAGPYDDFIQTDASINRGNSGGPMFNREGKVIGINTAIFSPSGGSVGIGFATPSNLAQPVIRDLIKHGETRRGWLGVRIQTVTKEIAESLGMEEPRGALVASVTPESPAKEAGFKPGDLILSYRGERVEAMRDLPRMVAETEIGAKAEVTILRNGERMTKTVEIGQLERAEAKGLLDTGDDDSGPDKPGAQPESTTLEGLGLSVQGLSPRMRKQFGLSEDAEGVVITDVAGHVQAARKGLSAGDVILEIDQRPVKNAGQAAELVASARDAGKSSVLLLVRQQGRGDVRFVALEFENDDE